MNAEAVARPPRIFPVALFLIALPLAIGGAQLLMLGGSAYYIAAGLVLAFSGFRLWQGNPAGSIIYGAFLAVTVLWALSLAVFKEVLVVDPENGEATDASKMIVEIYGSMGREVPEGAVEDFPLDILD